MKEPDIIDAEFEVIESTPLPPPASPVPIWAVLLVIGFAWRILSGH